MTVAPSLLQLTVPAPGEPQRARIVTDTAHYGIDTTATRRWRPFVEDGMLCVDLTEEGTDIIGNRTMTANTPAAKATEATESMEMPQGHGDENTATEND